MKCYIIDTRYSYIGDMFCPVHRTLDEIRVNLWKFSDHSDDKFNVFQMLKNICICYILPQNMAKIYLRFRKQQHVLYWFLKTQPTFQTFLELNGRISIWSTFYLNYKVIRRELEFTVVKKNIFGKKIEIILFVLNTFLS